MSATHIPNPTRHIDAALAAIDALLNPPTDVLFATTPNTKGR